MALDPLEFVKLAGEKVATMAGSWAKTRFDRWNAARKARRGADLAREQSFSTSVHRELRTLADGQLPPELQSESARNWLTSESNLELFVEVLLAVSGGSSGATAAREELARRFEEATGDTKKLAQGPINLAISHVAGQLRASPSNEHIHALNLRTAARLDDMARGNAAAGAFPTDSDLDRVRALSSSLLSAGKAAWKTPRFVAPLVLQQVEEVEAEAGDEEDSERGSEKHRPTSADKVAVALASGKNVAVFGEGGIGKTTFLLELAESLASHSPNLISLYLDASMWARSGATLIDYLAGTPAAQAGDVSTAELAKLAQQGYLLLLVNGWNEIPAERKAFCQQALTQLTATAPKMAVTVASRASSDTATLLSPMRVLVRGLTWGAQSSVIHAELDEQSATSLVELLAKDTRLRHAARSPLILHGLLALAKSGQAASASPFDLLGAVVRDLELDDQRRPVLNAAPVFSLQAHYLGELATTLNSRQTTSASREEALMSLSAAATKLLSKGVIGAMPQPAEVLEALASHHVLHIEASVVRFAHQRFQEYFAAERLLRVLKDESAPLDMVTEAVNQPFWADSLELVAGKLKRLEQLPRARARLIEIASAVDLVYACELAGACQLTAADDSNLHSQLVLAVERLNSSALREVRELAMTTMIASRFLSFAPHLWDLLENDDEQTRLNWYLSGEVKISVAQLGHGASARVATWPVERQIEFIFEVADNPENYDFLVSVARSEGETQVRTAAISSLFWNFPASNAALDCWLDAPTAVQANGQLLGEVVEAFSQDGTSAQARQRIRQAADNPELESLRLRLALSDPDETSPTSVDSILSRLRTLERHADPSALIAAAKAVSPAKLRDLALELVSGASGAPDWVVGALRSEGPQACEAAFESVWTSFLSSDEHQRFNLGIAGAVANAEQTERALRTWLDQTLEGRTASRESTTRRQLVFGLLNHTSGEHLFNAVLRIGASSTYAEAVQLSELLLHRSSPEYGLDEDAFWLMSSSQFRTLFALFSKLEEPQERGQDELFVRLASIASDVDAIEFSPLLLEATRRQIDARAAYNLDIAEWAKRRSPRRPTNPMFGNYISAALTHWGIGALPEVLGLLPLPGAMDVLPEAIGRITSKPWALRKPHSIGSVCTDIQEGAERIKLGKVGRQPEVSQQSATDDAARALGRVLLAGLEDQAREPEANFPGARTGLDHRVRGLAVILANLPSPEALRPARLALASGLLDTYAFVGVIRGLTRQGYQLSDADTVAALEQQLAREASGPAMNEDGKSQLAKLAELTFLVEPASLLSRPPSHYLEIWRRHAPLWEVLRSLSCMKTAQSWDALMQFGSEPKADGKFEEDFVHAVATATSSRRVSEFCQLVADGSLFGWCGNAVTARRVAETVAPVFMEATAGLERLVDACSRAASPLADAFLGALLDEARTTEHLRMEAGLRALDEGRASDADSPAYEILLGTFTRHVSLGGGVSESYPNGCNQLRYALYERAQASSSASEPAIRLLAALESKRRARGRPYDESRHPAIEDGKVWTDVLMR